MKSRAKTLKRKSKVRRKGDPIPWKYCMLTLLCGLLLVSGFFWAARTHFSSMNYGMKNAKLRKQIEELKSEHRRNKLNKEIAHSPAQIERAAKKLGLRKTTARNIEVVAPTVKKEVRAYVEGADKEKPKDEKKTRKLEIAKTTGKKGKNSDKRLKKSDA